VIKSLAQPAASAGNRAQEIFIFRFWAAHFDNSATLLRTSIMKSPDRERALKS
jgi:hypothetical protein